MLRSRSTSKGSGSKGFELKEANGFGINGAPIQIYFAEMRGSRLDHKMDHLACFIGGMFGLTAANTNVTSTKAHYFKLAADISYTCHESYVRSATGIGPESFRFTNEFEAKTINDRDKYYILRPEVVESWFYMWRLTGEQKYRDWVWAAAQVIRVSFSHPIG